MLKVIGFIVIFFLLDLIQAGVIIMFIAGGMLCRVGFAIKIQGLCTSVGLGESGIFGAIKNLGNSQILPVATLEGFLLAICLTFAIGSTLIFFLAINDMIPKNRTFYPFWFFPIYFSKIIPFTVLLPTWTALAVVCGYYEDAAFALIIRKVGLAVLSKVGPQGAALAAAIKAQQKASHLVNKVIKKGPPNATQSKSFIKPDIMLKREALRPKPKIIPKHAS